MPVSGNLFACPQECHLVVVVVGGGVVVVFVVIVVVVVVVIVVVVVVVVIVVAKLSLVPDTWAKLSYKIGFKL